MNEVPPFFLTDEQWIFAVSAENGLAQEYSIRHLLERAHLLKELSANSPLMLAAILRLLLAVLYRATVPEGQKLDKSRWKEIWMQQQLPMDTVNAYLDKWKPRFDLFDKEYPFFQVGGMKVKDSKGADNISGLHYLASDLDCQPHPIVLIPAQAARYLVAAQSYTLGGTLQRLAVLGDESFYTHSSNPATLVEGAALWLSGETLFETLMLNLAPQSRGSQDAPCWELDSYWEYRDKDHDKAFGAMDAFTWQSRFILLLPRVDAGETLVDSCFFTMGRPRSREDKDPMICYTQEKDKMKPIALDRDKSAWRDAHALLDMKDDAGKPASFREVSALTLNGTLPKAKRLRVNVIGIASNNAKVYVWRHDQMSIPAILLQAPKLEAKLREWLEWPNDQTGKWGTFRWNGVARKLAEATEHAIKLFLKPDYYTVDGKRNSSVNEPHREEVNYLKKTLDPLPLYWARLETHFQQLLLQIGKAPEDENNWREAEGQWADSIRNEAQRAFREVVSAGLGNSAKAIQAVARTNTSFFVDRPEATPRSKTPQGKNKGGT